MGEKTMRLLCEHHKIKSGVCDLIVDTDDKKIEGYVPLWAGEDDAPLSTLVKLVKLQHDWREDVITLLDVITVLRQLGYIIRGTPEEFRELERVYPNIWEITKKRTEE